MLIYAQCPGLVSRLRWCVIVDARCYDRDTCFRMDRRIIACMHVVENQPDANRPANIKLISVNQLFVGRSRNVVCTGGTSSHILLHQRNINCGLL